MAELTGRRFRACGQALGRDIYARVASNTSGQGTGSLLFVERLASTMFAYDETHRDSAGYMGSVR